MTEHQVCLMEISFTNNYLTKSMVAHGYKKCPLPMRFSIKLM